MAGTKMQSNRTAVRFVFTKSKNARSRKMPAELTGSPGRPSFGERIRQIGIKRLLAICLGMGVGIGMGAASLLVAIAFYLHRSVAPRDWPVADLSVGVKANLRTDYNDDKVRYRLRVAPASVELNASFAEAVRSRAASKDFRIELYDKAGFLVCYEDVHATPKVDSNDQVAALEANGRIIGCDRTQYMQTEHWNVGYHFPRLTAESSPNTVPAKANELIPQMPAKSPPAVKQKQPTRPQSADDTMTGFDLLTGDMEVRSGKTFLIYRPGEKDTALGWQSRADVTGTQPKVHYECDAMRECLIENLENKQAVHGRLTR